MSEKDPKRVVTGEVRLSYPHLFKPQAINDGPPRYSTVIFWPKGDHRTTKAIQAGFDAAIEDGIASNKFTAREVDLGRKSGFTKGIKCTLRDGDEDADLEKNPEYEGCYYMNVSAGDRKPGIIDRRKNLITDESMIYPGVVVRVSITAFAYKHPQGGRGVSYGLNHVQWLRDEESLGAFSKAEDAFDDLDDDEDDIDDLM